MKLSTQSFNPTRREGFVEIASPLAPGRTVSRPISDKFNSMLDYQGSSPFDDPGSLGKTEFRVAFTRSELEQLLAMDDHFCHVCRSERTVSIVNFT